MVIFLKVLRGVAILGALLLAIVPTAILMDLVAGGTGYGFCEGGLSGCDTAHLAGPVLAARILAGLLLVAGLIRLLSRTIDRIEQHRHVEEVYAYFEGLQNDPARPR